MSALGVVIVALIGPLLLVVANTWQHSRSKREDWAREDLVAERVAALKEANDARAAAVTEKLDAIDRTGQVVHGLVNSTLTMSKQAEHDTLVSNLALLKIVAKIGTGQEQIDAQDLIESTQERLTKLELELMDRASAAEQLAGKVHEADVAEKSAD